MAYFHLGRDILITERKTCCLQIAFSQRCSVLRNLSHYKAEISVRADSEVCNYHLYTKSFCLGNPLNTVRYSRGMTY
jgi:hypothetical protein